MTSRADVARRRLVPEVIQSSALDCGPAAAHALLAGHGISCGYERLRVACQTSLDGTSIDVLEEVLRSFGLQAEQLIVPPEHVLDPDAGYLPSLLTVLLPDQATHFVVAWRRHGGRIQVMDPASGRRYPTAGELLREVYRHGMVVDEDAWMTFARSDDMLGPLRRRLAALGVPGARARELAEVAARASEPWPLAALDAAARLLEDAVGRRSLRRGPEAARILEVLARRGAVARGPVAELPEWSWGALPAPAAGPSDAEPSRRLLVRGAVLVRVRAGRSPSGRAPAVPAAVEVVPPPSPLAEIWRMLREDGAGPLWSLGATVVIAAAGLIAEALVMRGLFDAAEYLRVPAQRGAALALVGLLPLGLLALDWGIASGARRLGRGLEARFRLRLYRALPRQSHGFFLSRLPSDLVERAHRAHVLRRLPPLLADMARSASALALTWLAVLWLDPRAAPPALGAAVAAGVGPFFLRAALLERDLRVRTHDGALARTYLDALRGILPLRAQGAEGALRAVHGALVARWAEAVADLGRTGAAAQALSAVVAAAFAALALSRHVVNLDRPGASSLLLVYWILQLPLLGQQLVAAWRAYPEPRSVVARLLEPLSVPLEQVAGTGPGPSPGAAVVDLQGVAVDLMGCPVLRDVTLRLDAGSHTAVVGASGSGKSTLVRTLLGLHRPDGGEVRIGGSADVDWRAWRRETAWASPDARLWNRTLLDNVAVDGASGGAVGRALSFAGLEGLVGRLPDGLQSGVGEAGTRLSGGEGQRVRLARAHGVAMPRLVLLDEALRGLDPEARAELLPRLRARWSEATLLHCTHDAREAMTFPRVIVMEAGRIAEDGDPSALARRDGPFQRLLAAEAAIDGLWGTFTSLHVDRGRIAATGARPAEGGTA